MGSVLRKFAAVSEWLHREFVAAWPVFIFFLISFLLLFSIIKLVLEDFSIEVTAFSKAVVGALFAAKAVLILDETPLARHLEQYRRILAVAVKTFIYGAITLLLGFLERLLEARHRVHTFAAATDYVVDHASMYRLFAWALGISLVFAIYFALFEIDEFLGKGALWTLFFESPRSLKSQKTAGGASQHSNINVGSERS
ncbi:MAG: hypothetical protein ABSC63_21470 [Candidatus Binataceae bacterium]